MEVSAYPEVFRGIPRMVWPAQDGRHPTHVIFGTGPGKTDRVYTWDRWAASFCEQAYAKQIPIIVAWQVTSWGKLVIDLDFESAA